MSQNEYKIVHESKPTLEDIGVLNAGLSAYAKQKRDLDPVEHFAFFIKDQSGQILGGCSGDIFYGCLYTGSFWITESLRGKGLGTQLLSAAEQLGREKGCTMATVNTMDWEALDFYKSLGYEVDLAREGYKNNSTFYFLMKELG
jgi:GNAT superfamily N-acetyltransferase